MSKKVFALVSGIVGALQTAGVAIVTYIAPENATAINSAIVVVGAAIIEVCTKFVKPEYYETTRLIGSLLPLLLVGLLAFCYPIGGRLADKLHHNEGSDGARSA